MKLKTKLKVVAVIVLAGGAIGYALMNQKVQVEYKQEEIVSVVKDEKASIRSRADIQRQQELIVEEAYLLEEKAKFEASLKDVETRLDAVRKEKVGFTYPLKQLK